MMNTFWAWVNALLEQWLIAMSGLFIVGVGVLERFRGRPAVEARWYLAAVLFAFAVANYAAWV